MQYKYFQESRAERPHRKLNPERWLSGPTMWDRERFYAWHKHRSQAKYRKEAYELTYPDWQQLWHDPDEWAQRGRARDALVLTRKDLDKPWRLDNVEIITRLEQLQRHTSEIHTGMKYAPRKPRDAD